MKAGFKCIMWAFIFSFTSLGIYITVKGLLSVFLKNLLENVLGDFGGRLKTSYSLHRPLKVQFI